MTTKLKILPIMLAIVVLAFSYTACEEPAGSKDEDWNPDELSQLYEYLIAQEGGKSRNDPIDLKLSIQLTEPNWMEFLLILEGARKYVSLNLSECDYSDSSSSTIGGLNRDQKFNPIVSVVTGKSRIVDLILPIEAKEISGSFTNFNSLRKISGENITTIPSSAFSGLSSLVAANFPKASSIGNNAFSNCINLEEIIFPAASTITYNPFVGCTSVVFTLIGSGNLSIKEDGRALINNQTELISFPAATDILTMDYLTTLGNYCLSRTSITQGIFENVVTVKSDALYYCSSLMTLSLPKAAIINSWAFYGNTNLTQLSILSVNQIDTYALSTGNVPMEITMGATAPGVLGTSIFSNSTNTITVRVPAGAIGYDDTWVEAFKGKGTSGTGTVNSNLILIFEEAP